MATDTYVGPLGYAVFALPADHPLDAVAAELSSLTAQGRAVILDVELVSRQADGTAARRRLSASPALAAVETDLLLDTDLERIASELRDGEDGLVVVYEDRTLAGLADVVSRDAGRELLLGGIDPTDLDTLQEGEDR
ncbi:hypothetical protein [Sanguibacter sp. HDW7]|uniref:hypothetical protein n=1 Tax=Sanguibacter sp. HDW7 TaxID=2714931 RepID=UPI001408A5C9|nr:hypothetical protein [Sanguibacter sp. HDW7]QIK82454.1 hypothetical protein G7063_01605 [Sanguibacter sp. HDW7]